MRVHQDQETHGSRPVRKGRLKGVLKRYQSRRRIYKQVVPKYQAVQELDGMFYPVRSYEILQMESSLTQLLQFSPLHLNLHEGLLIWDTVRRNCFLGPLIHYWQEELSTIRGYDKGNHYARSTLS